jgi:curved DNA-binding protein CbpA
MLSAVPERENLYRILQVDPAASPLVIQAAYRVLARIFHPDVEGDDAQMKRINHAWSILGDARLRAEYDREVAGRHSGTGGAAWSARSSHPDSASTQAAPSRPATTSDDHAGPPRGEPSGPVLTFGRYEGWTIGQVARIDPSFLEWLRRVPAGRQLKDAIDGALQRADGARRMGLRSDAGSTNNGAVHTWAPGAPTRVR